jgi:hypothetical protein
VSSFASRVGIELVPNIPSKNKIKLTMKIRKQIIFQYLLTKTLNSVKQEKRLQKLSLP